MALSIKTFEGIAMEMAEQWQIELKGRFKSGTDVHSERLCLAYNGGNMASKANHRTTLRSTNLTWLLCYIAC